MKRIVITLLSMFILFLTGCEDSHITEIKESLLFDRQDITWGDLFKNIKVCDNPEWNYSENSKGQEFVQVKCSLAKYAETGSLSEIEFYKNYTDKIVEDNYEYKTELYKRYQKALVNDLKKEYGGYYKQYLDFVKKRSLLIIFKLNKNGTFSFYNALAGHYLDGFLDTNKLPDLKNQIDIVNFYPKEQLVKDERLYKHFSSNKFSSEKERELFLSQNKIISKLLQTAGIIPVQNCLIQDNEGCFTKNFASPLFKPNDAIDYDLRSQDIFLSELLNSINENLNKKSYVFLLTSLNKDLEAKAIKLKKLELSKSELGYAMPKSKGFPRLTQTIRIESENGDEYFGNNRISLKGKEGDFKSDGPFLNDLTGTFRIPFRIDEDNLVLMYVSLLPEKTELCTSTEQIKGLEYNMIKKDFVFDKDREETRLVWDKFLDVVKGVLESD